MNLKEIASRCGVSASTVSRVINGKDKCATEQVKNRIWQVVRESGYVPNQSARQLKNSAKDGTNTQTRLYVLYARAKSSGENEFFNQLASAVEREALRMGCSVSGRYLLSDITEVDARNLTPTTSDGLVILGRSSGEANEFVAKFRSRVVGIALIPTPVPYDTVRCDGKLAGETALNCLFQNGHRKIAYIGEIYNEIRYSAYKEFLHRNGLKSDPSYEIDTLMTEEGGKNACDRFLQITDRPTAVFCANDVTAIGLLNQLRKRNVRVPEDVSVVSIDNIVKSETVRPSLTTVNVPIEEMGSLATKLLCDRINKGHKTRVEATLPSEILIRESVKLRPNR